MPSLADLQRDLRRAVVLGDVAGLIPSLVGGGDVAARLRIHQRHYQTSLVEAIVARFAATGWLVGAAAVYQAAEAFLRAYPPRAVCIAEYGDAFPRFLGDGAPAVHAPYVRWFAELEGHLGQVSLAVDDRPLDISAVAALGAAVVDAEARLQPGLRYLEAPWPVDELMRLYLTDTAPELLAFSAEDVWIEVRGARGQFTMRRLDAAEYAFRRGLVAGRPLGEAAEQALDTGLPFDAGASLMGLFDDGLITTMALPTKRKSS